MSRDVRVSDIAVIHYGNNIFNTKIISINGLVLTVQDIVNGTVTTLTWNGSFWTLPGNIRPENVSLYNAESQNSSLSTTQPLQPAKAVCIKADKIRPKYDNLDQWMQDPNNLYTGRHGRIFITENGNRRIFHYPASKWANPFNLKDYTLEESIRLYKEHLVKSGLISQVSELKGKNLGCFCDQSEVCHAQILAQLANAS